VNDRSGDMAFLSGGGKMGARIRTMDWSGTSLGPIGQWPQSLRSVINLLLQLRFPAILFWGTDLTAIHNDACLPLLESGRNALGRSFHEVWQGALDRFRPLADNALAGKPGFVNVPFTVMRNGRPEQTRFDFHFSPLGDETNVVAGVLATAIETNRREAPEWKFRELVRRAPAAIYEIDFLNRRFLSVNDVMCESLGYTRQELLATDPLEILDTTSKPRLLERFGKMLAGEKPEEDVEYKIRTKAGGVIDVALSVSFNSGADGNPMRATVVGFNITERKRTEEALEKSRTELEQRVAERTSEAEQRAIALRQLALELSNAEDLERRRIATILHDDLQQYLASLRFRLGSLIPDDWMTPEIAQGFALFEAIIVESIRKCRDLSHELSPPVLHQSGLLAALDWLAKDMEEKHGLNVSLHTNPDAEPASIALASTLFRSIRELLFNVVKHSGAECADVRVDEKNGGIQICVTDPGRGFDITDVRKHRGTGGFGLFNIEERIRFLGGAVDFESAPGRGSRIELQVPKDGPRLPERLEPLREEIRPPRAVEALPNLPAVIKGKIRILLADDHAVMRKGLASLLEKEADMEIVAEAADGLEAVDLSKRMRPDVVLMDVSMPRMDGIAATAEISRSCPSIRVIGLSMHDDAATREKMIGAGASAYIYKAAPSEKLIEAVRSVRKSSYLYSKWGLAM